MAVEFHFDFGSPNAYLSRLVIPGIEERTGVSFEYVPVLLGGVFKLTGNASPMVSMAGIRNKPEYQNLETRRFIEAHGITDFAFNPHFPINTLQAMRGAGAARRAGCFDPYLDCVFRYMWSEPRKMDDESVLRGALAEAMEGAAVALAANETGCPFVEVRGISNEAGDRDHSRWDIDLACKNAARVVAHLSLIHI
mgnify:CR=1 FL=1